MQIFKPPSCDYDADLGDWLLRLSSQLNSTQQMIGTYLQFFSSTTFPGIVGFNRDHSTGDHFDTSKSSFQFTHTDEKLYWSAYNTAEANTGYVYLGADGAFYASGNVSALSFTDRTKWFDGDALDALADISGKDGEIDHESLPEFATKDVVSGGPVDPHDPNAGTTSSIKKGRDLGAMITLLTIAVQQLVKRVESVESALKSVTPK